MAATVQIQVEVDASGAVKGLQQVRTGFDTMGQSASAGAQGVDASTNAMQKAHIAGLLLERDIGVHLPRALLNLILQSQAAQMALTGLFGITSGVLLVQSLAVVLPKLEEVSDWAAGYSKELKEVEKDAKQVSDQALANPKTMADANAHLKALRDEQEETQRLGKSLSNESGFYKVILGYAQEIVGLKEKDERLGIEINKAAEARQKLEAAEKAALEQMDKQLAESGLQGFSAIRQKVIDLQLDIAKGHQEEIQNIGADIAAGKKLTDVQQHYLEAGALGQVLNATLRRQLNDEAIKLEQQAGAVGLGTLDAIAQKASNEIADLKRKYQELGAAPTDPTLHRDVAAIQTRAAKESMDARMDMERRLADQVAQTEGEAAVRSVAPWQRANAQIEVDFENRLRQIDNEEREQLKQAGGNAELRAQIEEAAQQRRKDAALGADAKMIESDRQYNEQMALDAKERADLVQREEEKAAADSLPPWLRADAEAAASYRHRLDEIDEWRMRELEKNKSDAAAMADIEKDAQRRRVAAAVDEDARIADDWRKTRDKMAGDLESLFSGDISKEIQKQIKHFFFEMLASELMGIDGMRQAASDKGKGGGLLGGLLSGIFDSGDNQQSGGSGGLLSTLRSIFSGGNNSIVYQSGPGPALPTSVAPVLPPTGPSGVFGTVPALASLVSGGDQSGGAGGLLSGMVSTVSASTSMYAVPVWVVGSSASADGNAQPSVPSSGGGLLGSLRSILTGDKTQPIVDQAGAGPALPASAQAVAPPSGPSDVYGTAPGMGAAAPLPSLPSTDQSSTAMAAAAPDIPPGATLPAVGQPTFSGGAVVPPSATFGGADTSGGYAGGPTSSSTAAVPAMGAAPLSPGGPSSAAVAGDMSGIWPGGNFSGTSSTAALAAPGEGFTPTSTAATPVTWNADISGLQLPAITPAGPLGAGTPSAGAALTPKPGATLDQPDAAMGLVSAGIGMLGAKLGGTAGSIGGLLTSLSTLAYGSSAAGTAVWDVLGFLGPAMPIMLSAAGGALVGFGVGESHGKLEGALAGVGAGALVGLEVGGPIGAVIGAIAGLVGGLVGGVLGGDARRAQANAYAQKQVEPALNKALEDYNLHQGDFASTLANMVSIQDQAQKALSQLKGEGEDVMKNRIAVDIQKQLDQITTTEAERQRRAALQFGPSQFQEGGYVDPYLPRNPEGGIAAVLHPEEFVSTAAATALHRAELESWNLGAGSAGSPAAATTSHSGVPQFQLGGFVMSALQRGVASNTNQVSRPAAAAPSATVQIQAWDGPSVERWMRNGGDRLMKTALVRAWREYSGSGPDIGY